jgi:hypothetical protein
MSAYKIINHSMHCFHLIFIHQNLLVIKTHSTNFTAAWVFTFHKRIKRTRLMWDLVNLNFWTVKRVNSWWILSAVVKYTDVQSRSHKALTNWWIFITLYKLLSLPHVHFTWCLVVTNSSLITRNADLIGSEVWGSSYYYGAPSTGTRIRHVSSAVRPTRWNMDSYYNPLTP